MHPRSVVPFKAKGEVRRLVLTKLTNVVSYRFRKALVTLNLTCGRVPKGSNFGSERVKLWFRKGQTIFPYFWFLKGQRQFASSGTADWFPMGQTFGS